jgi:hypothetical protein
VENVLGSACAYEVYRNRHAEQGAKGKPLARDRSKAITLIPLRGWAV